MPELHRSGCVDEVRRIGRYREAAFIGRTAVESFMYASRDSFLAHAVNLVRFMDSVPGFEDADPPQSEYIASLRADGRMQREFWELYDRQRVPKRRVGYIWRDYRLFEYYDNYKDYNEIVIYSLRVDSSARKDRMDGSEARLEEGT